MKKIILGLIILFVGSQFFVSCSSNNEVLSQFSKRKYLKKFKKQSVKYEDEINTYEYTAENVTVDEKYSNDENDLDIEISNIIDNSEFGLEESDLQSESYETSSIEEEVDFELIDGSIEDIYEEEQEERFLKVNSEEIAIHNLERHDDDVMFVILVVLAILLSPLAVYLKEDGFSNNFWINFILWALGVGLFPVIPVLGIFWLIGVVHALLIVLEEI